MNREAVEARGLSKTYGSGPAAVQVLKAVDLSVKVGEVVAVVGPSGAGKTTLLYLLGGLAKPSSGSVVLGGTPLTGLSDAAISQLRSRKVGFVFQSHNLLPELTAEENVALALRIGGKAAGAALRSARQLLMELGLGVRAGHKPGELSGGEQQRVAVARALAGSPEVILADEPTGNLDRANSEAVFELLTGAAKQRGQAVVMVTHNDELAGRADRRVRMRDGKIIS